MGAQAKFAKCLSVLWNIDTEIRFNYELLFCLFKISVLDFEMTYLFPDSKNPNITASCVSLLCLAKLGSGNCDSQMSDKLELCSMRWTSDAHVRYPSWCKLSWDKCICLTIRLFGIFTILIQYLIILINTCIWTGYWARSPNTARVDVCCFTFNMDFIYQS